MVIQDLRLLENFEHPNLIEIGPRGMLEHKDIVRGFLAKGGKFLSDVEGAGNRHQFTV